MKYLFVLLFVLTADWLQAQNNCPLKEEKDPFAKTTTYKISAAFSSADKQLAAEFSAEPKEKRVVVQFVLKEGTTVICLEQIAIIKLLFEDGETYSYVQTLNYNCDGHAATVFGRSSKAEKKLIEKLKSVKIAAIRIPIYNGVFDYKFSAAEAEEFKHCMLCAADKL